MSIVVRDTYNYRQIWWLDKFLIGHKGYIAGGCFKNIFNNERVNDIDMFFECEFAYYKNYDNVDEDNYLAVYEVAFQEEFFEHLHTKRLVIDDDLLYPVSTFNRIMKYAKYGYQPCRETKIRMITELAKLSTDDKDFEEQLGKSFYEGMD